MRLNLLPLLGLLPALISAAAKKPAALDVEANIKFPTHNAFAKVFNGVATNALQVRVDNHHNTDIVLTAVRGQFFDLAAKKERPLKKTTKLDLRQPVSAGAKSPLVLYKFFSENRVGDVGLKVWVDYTADGKSYSILGFDGTVNVVEKKGSWFDPALLFAYAIVAGAVYLAGVVAFSAFAAPSPTGRPAERKPKPVVAKEAGPVSTDPAENEWLAAQPHHLKIRKGRAAAKEVGVTSGSESEVEVKKTK